MLEHAITYTDFNGVERTDTFYFHLSKSSIVEIAMNVLGIDAGPDVDVQAIMRAIAARGDAAEVIDIFKNFIRKSVGEKSPDGRRFIQSPEVVDGFMESNAYQELFMRLMTDDEFRESFMENILPSELSEKFVQARNEPRDYTTEELMAMDDEQFYNVAGDIKSMTPKHMAIAMQRKNRAVA